MHYCHDIGHQVLYLFRRTHYSCTVDILQDPIREVKRLCEFLEKDIELQVLRDIVHLCDFNKMKKDKDPLEDLDEWKDQQPGMYRKGKFYNHLFTTLQWVSCTTTPYCLAPC